LLTFMTAAILRKLQWVEPSGGACRDLSSTLARTAKKGSGADRDTSKPK
jgi:hypothetical protein